MTIVKLKKFNAVTALITVVLMLAHIGYNAFCYLTFYYNPVLKTVFSVPVMVSVCIHAVCGMLSVFLLSDGTALARYPKQNRNTVIQRVSAALIFPLLILHIQNFDLLKSAAEGGKLFQFYLLLAVNIVFYFDVMLHISLSVSRALITLGLLSSKKTQEKTDRFCLICGTVVIIVVAYIVIKGQIGMFLG